MPAPADSREEVEAVAALVVVLRLLQVLRVLPPQVALLLQVAVAEEEDSPVAVAVVAAEPVSRVVPRTQRRSVPA
jgi:hypothetical protein